MMVCILAHTVDMSNTTSPDAVSLQNVHNHSANDHVRVKMETIDAAGSM